MKTEKIILGIDGKRAFRYIEDEYGGGFVVDGEAGGMLGGFTGGVVLTCFESKAKKAMEEK